MSDLNQVATKAYDKAARRYDSGQSVVSPKLATNRAVQDAIMSERHRGFDLSAKDNHMKYERPKFAVVGEGTKTANDKYHAGYAKIDWSR